MEDLFLSYKFNKPEYIESEVPTIGDFADIPNIPLDTTTKDYAKPEKIDEEIKALPKPTVKPLLPPETKLVKDNKSNKLSMKDFKEKLLGDATRVAEKLRIDPNVILAQAFLESGGDISKPLFGIKAQKGYKGTSQSYSTKEQVGDQLVGIKDNFRTYGNLSEAFDDYGNLISGRRYKSAMGKDAQQYYETIKNQGYATADHYVPALMKVFNQMKNT